MDIKMIMEEITIYINYLTVTTIRISSMQMRPRMIRGSMA